MVTYPKDWEETTLGKIVTFTKGAPLSKKDISTSGVPLILYGELYTTYKEVAYKIERKTQSVVPSANISRIGDVIVPTSGETAEEIATACCVMQDGVVLGGDLNILRSQTVDGRFLSYIINHVINRQIADAAQGISIIHISAKELEKISLCIPSDIEIQKRIADTIQYFDTHIDNLAELIEKKKNIRDGALEDLVSGKTRLDGFDDEWVNRTLEKLTTQIITGGTPSTSVNSYWGGNIPWLASTEIHQQRIVEPSKYITEYGLQNSSAKIAPSNSVLIALAGQGKTRGTAAILLKAMALNQSLAALVSSEQTDSSFLFYTMERSYCRLRDVSSGDGGRGGLNKKILKQFEIYAPKQKLEQAAIAEVLSTMDEEIANLEAEKDKMIQIREGAMDDLLTGRVRLPV